MVAYALFVHYHIIRTNLPLEPKSVFLGYPYVIKGYKVLNLESNTIYISRDIVFYEHIFPYAASVQPSNSYLDDFVFPHCVLNTAPEFPSSPSSPSFVPKTVIEHYSHFIFPYLTQSF